MKYYTVDTFFHLEKFKPSCFSWLYVLRKGEHTPASFPLSRHFYYVACTVYINK